MNTAPYTRVGSRTQTAVPTVPQSPAAASDSASGECELSIADVAALRSLGRITSPDRIARYKRAMEFLRNRRVPGQYRGTTQTYRSVFAVLPLPR